MEPERIVLQMDKVRWSCFARALAWQFALSPSGASRGGFWSGGLVGLYPLDASEFLADLAFCALRIGDGLLALAGKSGKVREYRCDQIAMMAVVRTEARGV